MAERDLPLTPTLSPAGRWKDSREAREGEGAQPDSARLCLGIITGAHGIRGRVRVKSFTADPEAIASYGPLSDESGARLLLAHCPHRASGVAAASRQFDIA